MYIPKSEMQQFQGQWICPNCRMDLQEGERHGKGRGASGEGGPGDEPGSQEMRDKLGECERCKRPTDVFYIVNGRKLCKFCFEQGKEYMARGPGTSPARIQIMRRKYEKKGLFRKILEFFFGKPEEPEYEIVEAEVIIPKKNEEPKTQKESAQKPPEGARAEIVPKKSEGQKPQKEEKPKHDWQEHKRE